MKASGIPLDDDRLNVGTANTIEGLKGANRSCMHVTLYRHGHGRITVLTVGAVPMVKAGPMVTRLDCSKMFDL